MLNLSLEGEYEYYRCLHHDFTEAFQIVNDYLHDLYTIPKRFIEDTSPAVDRYLRHAGKPGVPKPIDASHRSVFEFINQLDEFTSETTSLFEQHKVHVSQSELYIKRVQELNEHTLGRLVSEYAVDYVQLTPELQKLHENLEGIKSKADNMIQRMRKLEQRWQNIKTAVE